MREGNPKTVRLRDYTQPPYRVARVELRFELESPETRVHAKLSILAAPQTPTGAPLRLDGEGLRLERIAVDGRSLAPSDYTRDTNGLTLHVPPAEFELETEVTIRPDENTALEGLYRSGPSYCTQCEAEGFRRITFYPDRPDVLAVYTTTVVADRQECPVLLSNGNRVDSGTLPGGRHFATWHDPFPKPSYLFALVAGDLAEVRDVFTTRSGRKVDLHVYVDPGNEDRASHALASLARSMRWDEEVFGREYDLDIYMIVAVDFFNMGAMENKGLNIFNSKYVLARPDTATDDDYEHIEGVIAHEYFHNWSGNRVTCRDWFQLSLKEGFTVFRDQEYTADQTSRAVKRIGDVRLLRSHQFPEDAGPMAHPVRPDSYVEINNFYTVTVYEKGAELIRMLHRLVGAEGFRRGTDLYFERHDGQAVTTDDFVAAIADANGADLAQFKRWYTQAGTPVVRVQAQYDANTREYRLGFEQHTPDTPGQHRKLPLHMPIAVALLGPDGLPRALRMQGESTAGATERVLELREARETFVFVDVAEPPVPSLLRGFSAPVRLEYECLDDELAFRAAHDDDPFNRWDAGQQYAERLLLREIEDPANFGAPPAVFIEGLRRTLLDNALDGRLRAEALTLPGEAWLAECVRPVDPLAIHIARRRLHRTVADALAGRFAEVWAALAPRGAYSNAPAEIARRRLRNVCLAYLVDTGEQDWIEAAHTQFRDADNMTDQLAALEALSHTDVPERDAALAAFHTRWRDDPLVLDKWFNVQARSQRSDTFEAVQALVEHADFDYRNPNRVRSVVGAFAAGNPARFHAIDGAPYRWFATQILQLNASNPQIAARLLGPIRNWRRLEPVRRSMVEAQWQRILAHEGLSRDVYEIASKSLAEPA
ncbi:MAG: aminopeptidase N [Chromatiales bacterium]|nr:aminopeptidase N [Chromatiales bacterium]